MKFDFFLIMGRRVGIEPTHASATNWCVNHFTNAAISIYRISKNKEKSKLILAFC